MHYTNHPKDTTPHTYQPIDIEAFESYLHRNSQELSSLIGLEVANLSSEDSLHQAKQYSLGRRGKLLRPILGRMTAEILDLPPESVDGFIVATEKLHVASLDIDDFQDGSKDRRGVPALHLAFSTDTAILSSVSLIGSFFHDLARLKEKFDPEKVTRLIEYCGKKLIDLADGQNRDLNPPPEQTLEDLERVAILKTGSAIEMSMVGIAILADREVELSDKFTEYSKHFALAFQAGDDLLDVIGETKNTGKDSGSDARNGKATLVDACGGADKTREYIEKNISLAKNIASTFPNNPTNFLALAYYIVRRTL